MYFGLLAVRLCVPPRWLVIYLYLRLCLIFSITAAAETQLAQKQLQANAAASAAAAGLQSPHDEAARLADTFKRSEDYQTNDVGFTGVL